MTPFAITLLGMGIAVLLMVAVIKIIERIKDPRN
jgi:hypothetical protein